jgi:ribonuclease-3
MADRYLKRPANGRHDQEFPHKRLRHQNPVSSPFARPAQSVPQVTLTANLPPAPEIDAKYSTTVFTHQSAVPKDSNASEATSYDRLEFLGDAYLEVVASELIFDRFANLPAGRMSQVRESLVKNETLARLTEAYGWDKKIKNGHQLQRESAQAWLKIKGDVFEAYVAAIVLSHQDGLQVAKAWLQILWASALDSVAAKAPVSDQSKVELAKRIAGKEVKINYVDEKPPIIHKGQGVETYFVGVYLTGWGWDNQFLGSGKGLSRNAAGQEAAAAAINNRPLIDEVIAKRTTILAERKKGENK